MIQTRKIPTVAHQDRPSGKWHSITGKRRSLAAISIVLAYDLLQDASILKNSPVYLRRSLTCGSTPLSSCYYKPIILHIRIVNCENQPHLYPLLTLSTTHTFTFNNTFNTLNTNNRKSNIIAKKSHHHDFNTPAVFGLIPWDEMDTARPDHGWIVSAAKISDNFEACPWPLATRQIRRSVNGGSGGSGGGRGFTKYQGMAQKSDPGNYKECGARRRS